MAPRIRTGLVEGDFDIGAEVVSVKAASGSIGAVAVFLGAARDISRGKEVKLLTFEAYREMAETELAKLAGRAVERFSLAALTMLHRLGDIHPGDNIVLIIAAASHREEAFAAARWCIDELKKIVPIWKKEVFGDGEEWVQETP